MKRIRTVPPVKKVKRVRTVTTNERVAKLKNEILADIFAFNCTLQNNHEIMYEWSFYHLLCKVHPMYRQDYALRALELGVIKEMEYRDLKPLKK